jgi:hypothetical protein
MGKHEERGIRADEKAKFIPFSLSVMHALSSNEIALLRIPRHAKSKATRGNGWPSIMTGTALPLS